MNNKSEYPSVGQKVKFKKHVSSGSTGNLGQIRTIKAVLPYPCASEEGIKAKILWFEEDTEPTKFIKVKCGWCSKEAVTEGRFNDVNLHTVPIQGDLHLDSEFELDADYLPERA